MAERVREVLERLERRGSRRAREEMRTRYGIIAPKAFGVSMANIQQLAKALGRDHELAAALWDTGWYEARMLAAFVDEPARVTAAQMDRWCRDFDNWAHLRHGVLPPVRPHAARLAEGRSSGAAGATSS